MSDSSMRGTFASVLRGQIGIFDVRNPETGPDFEAVASGWGAVGGNPIGGSADFSMSQADKDKLTILDLRQELQKTKEALETAQANEGTLPETDRIARLKTRCVMLHRTLRNDHTMVLNDMVQRMEITKLNTTNAEQGVQIEELKLEVTQLRSTNAEQQKALYQVRSINAEQHKALELGGKEMRRLQLAYEDLKMQKQAVDKEVEKLRLVTDAPRVASEIAQMQETMARNDMVYRAEMARFQAEKTAEQEKVKRLTKELENETLKNRVLQVNFENKDKMLQQVLNEHEALRMSLEKLHQKNDQSLKTVPTHPPAAWSSTGPAIKQEAKEDACP